MTTAGNGRRALHYVLKIGDRRGAMNFFENILGMQVLRHEEFAKGCEATCNGPYDGKWSKTMVGYGPEDNNFVLELTYNYGISAYRHGNDYRTIEIFKNNITSVIASGAKKDKAIQNGCDCNNMTEAYTIESNGYHFNIFQHNAGDKINRVILSSSNLTKTLNYYSKVLELNLNGDDLNYPNPKGEGLLQFQQLNPSQKLDRGHAFGRIAFSCPTSQLKTIEATALKSSFGEKVQTPFVTLPTPDKADVHVVILADPDGHEICFVGDEGFRELSQVDPNAKQLLENAMAADKSDEWFAKKGRPKDRQLD